jgi:excisionase family DNA binding protein
MIPLTLTIPNAVEVSGMSRTAIYEALKAGRLVAVKAGRRTLIRYSSLTDYVGSLPSYKRDA